MENNTYPKEFVKKATTPLRSKVRPAITTDIFGGTKIGRSKTRNTPVFKEEVPEDNSFLYFPLLNLLRLQRPTIREWARCFGNCPKF